MEKLTLSQVTEKFLNYNKEHGIEYGESSDVEPLTAIIVFKQDNFGKKYTVKQRSYRIKSDWGKRFFSNMLGNSMWGDCLDGNDLRVRLDYYNWSVEYCYMEEAA